MFSTTENYTQYHTLSLHDALRSLIIKGVFKFKKYNLIKFNKVYIFKLKIVNKIKGKATNTLFKKLRLVI